MDSINIECSPLMSFQEYCNYLQISERTGRKLISNPKCKYVVRIGKKVLIHKEILADELKRAAKYQIALV